MGGIGPKSLCLTFKLMPTAEEFVCTQTWQYCGKCNRERGSRGEQCTDTTLTDTVQ